MKKAFLTLFLATTFPLGTFAQTAPQTEIPASQIAEAYYHFALARLLDERGQIDRSMEEYEKAVQLDPDNSQLYSEMAQTLWRHRRAADAVEAAERAAALDPDNIDAHRLLAVAYLSLLRIPDTPPSRDTIDRAIRQLEEIIRINPNDRDPNSRPWFLTLGQLYEYIGETDRAQEVYTRYLRIEPGSEDGIIALAGLHIDSDNGQLAIELLTAFLTAQPDSDRALIVLAGAYENLSDYSRAADVYRRVIALGVIDQEILMSYANALFFDDQFEEAGPIYEQLLLDDADNGLIMLRLSEIYRRQMKYDQARPHLERLAAVLPDEPNIQYNLFLLDRDEGLLEAAIQRASGLLARIERRTGAYTEEELQYRRFFISQVALLNSFLGRYEDSLRALDDLRDISPDGDKDRVDAFIVDIHRASKDLPRARDYAELALQEFPDSKQLRMIHSDVIAELGRVDEGVQALRQLSDAADLEIMSMISAIYERAGRYTEAQDVLDSARTSFPGEQKVHFLQGALYEKQARFDEAEQAFRRALEIESDNPSTLNYLGYMLTERNTKLEEALDMIQQAVLSDPTNGAYLDSLGWVYFKLARFDLAEQYLKKAIIFSGSDPTVHEHLGDLYFSQQRLSEAEAAWTRSLELSSDAEELQKIQRKIDQIKTPVANN